MARLLSAREWDEAFEPSPRGLKDARTQCYDANGAVIMCPFGSVEEADTAPNVPGVLSRTAQTTESEEPTDTDTPSVGENNGLGGVESTGTTTTSIMAKTTVASITTSSPTATETNASLVPVGTIEAPGNHRGLSSGAVAGIAIGTLIIGAVLAFIAAFLIFRRRNKREEGNLGGTGYRSYGDSAPELDMVQKSVGSLGDAHSPYVQVSQTPVVARRSVPPPAMPIAAAVAPENTTHTDVAGFLPPIARDNQVAERVSALFEKMHEHIERNYRDVHASITPSMEAGIASFGANGVNMTDLLRECSSPTTALKHALVAYVLSITGSNTQGNHGNTLFPEELSRAGAGSRSNSSDSNVVAAASLLRRVSAYLYTATSGPRESRQSWMAQSSAREAAEHFSLTFFPWANPTANDQQRDEDLTFIIMEALEISIWLFGQPDRYEFQWEGAGRGGVLISPGLVKRTVARGEEQNTVIVEGTVVGM